MGPVSIGVEVQRNTDGDTPSTRYIANAKNKCYIKQQSHSCESARQLTSVSTVKMTSVIALDGVTSF